MRAIDLFSGLAENPQNRYVLAMAEQNEPKNRGLFYEFWQFFKIRKKWWLLPILLMFALAALIIVFGQASVLSPFIYTLF